MQNAVSINIGGKEREIKFTRGAIAKMERILPKQNIYLTLGDYSFPRSVEAHVLIFALEGAGGKRPKLEVAEAWIDEYDDKNGGMALNAKLVEAAMLSGIMGNPSKFKEIIGEEEEAEEIDVKNE